MEHTLTKLIKKQEQKIFMIKQRILFTKRAKCPRCHSPIILNHTGKSARLCFFCPDCQIMFEK